MFSFYALEPEYELLKQVVNSGINLLGADQVFMYADRLIFQELMKETKNDKAKEYYSEIVEESKAHLEEFLENPENPMFFMTNEFSKILSDLKELDLSEGENMIIEDIRKSIEIYKSRDHNKRVQLIKRQLIKDYPEWKNAKNLFKYGANHLARGESFLTVYDIGNLIASLTEIYGNQSLHIMIVGKSGLLGSPFKNVPPTKVNINTGFLNSLKPFFSLTNDDEWYVFNLQPLRTKLNQGKLNIEDITLERTTKGYDLLVIIPEVTPANF